MKCDVQFANEKVKKAFEELDSGKYEEKQLKQFLERAIEDICKNAFCGVRIPKRLIPEEYVKKFGIHNVWKYNLPNAWRLIYSVESNQVCVISIILEWMDHKEYERRFNY